MQIQGCFSSFIAIFCSGWLAGQRSPLFNFDCLHVHRWPIETLLHCIWKQRTHYSSVSSPCFVQHYTTRPQIAAFVSQTVYNLWSLFITSWIWSSSVEKKDNVTKLLDCFSALLWDGCSFSCLNLNRRVHSRKFCSFISALTYFSSSASSCLVPVSSLIEQYVKSYSSSLVLASL